MALLACISNRTIRTIMHIIMHCTKADSLCNGF